MQGQCCKRKPVSRLISRVENPEHRSAARAALQRYLLRGGGGSSKFGHLHSSSYAECESDEASSSTNSGPSDRVTECRLDTDPSDRVAADSQFMVKFGLGGESGRGGEMTIRGVGCSNRGAAEKLFRRAILPGAASSCPASQRISPALK